ncbi:MAG: sigma-54 dependent transcriptional regulator, partial [Victivallaceae bacterium]|nr:sigma-54 dependent transcriptional regulator [Victivallaceae bacterium]
GQRELKGSSPVMTRLHAIINKVGPKDSARVFIHGASGTGKETVAIQLHEKSPRRQKPFITFNCATTSTSLVESQLFGYVKGAFTGATNGRSGIFEEADGGTLFLDEIGELSLEIQANILRVLQEGCFNRVGSHQEVQVDVRIITATNRDLVAMVKTGTFREDLFYRLNVIPIYVPPLSEHLADIKDIANSFWYRWHSKALSSQQIEALENYNWPGNVRELGNFLEYASVLEDNDFATLLVEHRQRLEPLRRDIDEPELPDNLDDLTRYHAQKLFDKYEHNISRTAKTLGITRNTLKKYLRM